MIGEGAAAVVLKRVDDAITNARQAADTARKTARNLSLFIAFSMLIGAFVAGVSAKVGGHHRDDLDFFGGRKPLRRDTLQREAQYLILRHLVRTAESGAGCCVAH